MAGQTEAFRLEPLDGHRCGDLLRFRAAVHVIEGLEMRCQLLMALS